MEDSLYSSSEALTPLSQYKPIFKIKGPHLNDSDLLKLACNFALASRDTSTQNGAFLAVGDIPILETGVCNDIPQRVVFNTSRLERPLKYAVTEHAERNAIFKAASLGIPTHGLTLVCPWAACSDCSRAIIQSEIRELLTLAPKVDVSNPRWDASIDIAMQMLKEAGVNVRYYEGNVGGPELLRNGKLFQP